MQKYVQFNIDQLVNIYTIRMFMVPSRQLFTFQSPYQSEHRVLLELLSLKIRFYSYQFPDINTLEQCEQNRCVLVKILRSLKTLYGHIFRSKNMGQLLLCNNYLVLYCSIKQNPRLTGLSQTHRLLNSEISPYLYN